MKSAGVIGEAAGKAAMRSERPTTVFIFLDQGMEQAILDKELKHHGLSEEEIKKRKIFTKFDVRRTPNGAWDVRVTGQGIDPNLKYDE